jgi:hypothetical protein
MLSIKVSTGFLSHEFHQTNNRVEQTIRRVVLDRHVTQGTRSEKGNKKSYLLLQ